MMTTATAVVKKDDQVNALRDLLNKALPSIREVIPKHLNAERITKIALVAASRNHKLAECTPLSFLRSVMDASQLGLEPDGPLGQGYLVPFWNKNIKKYEAQFMPGYRGLIGLARRSGMVLSMEARVVYRKDKFECEFGTNQRLTHIPSIEADKGEPICVYAVAHIKDSMPQIEVMTVDEVNAIRARSKAKDDGPWITDWAEMARKTVIKRISKYIPMSTELAQAVEYDNQHFGLDGIDDVRSISLDPISEPEPIKEIDGQAEDITDDEPTPEPESKSVVVEEPEEPEDKNLFSESDTEANAIRARSKAKDDGPWITDRSEMARKIKDTKERIRAIGKELGKPSSTIDEKINNCQDDPRALEVLRGSWYKLRNRELNKK